MTESAENAVKRAVEGVRGFEAEMREKGIHVGMGNPGRCVTCDEAVALRGQPRSTEREGLMGTRADFYLGRGPEAEWLGSIAWDGHPGSVVSRQPQSGYVSPPADEQDWRTEVAAFLAQRRDATLPEQGWPWPWEDSRTTDYAYAYDGGTLWASCFGYCWFVATEAEPEDDGPKTAVFPNMKNRQKVTYGRRSGVMIIGDNGPVDPDEIDASEAGQS